MRLETVFAASTPEYHPEITVMRLDKDSQLGTRGFISSPQGQEPLLNSYFTLRKPIKKIKIMSDSNSVSRSHPVHIDHTFTYSSVVIYMIMRNILIFFLISTFFTTDCEMNKKTQQLRMDEFFKISKNCISA